MFDDRYKKEMAQIKPSRDLINRTKTAMRQEMQSQSASLHKAHSKINDEEQPTMKKSTFRRFFGTVAACLALVLTGITVFAAVRRLTPGEIAYQLDNPSLSAAFESEDAIHINASQISGGYRFTLLSLVSGYAISDSLPEGLSGNRTYLVVAIEREDGSAMADIADEASLYISPYIRGYAPWLVNLHTLEGGHHETVIDGVRYRIIDMENIKAFAGHGIYIGINAGWFFDRDAFIFNADPWEFRANTDFDGASVVFELPVGLSFADPVRAAEILDANPILQNDGLPAPSDESEAPFFYSPVDYDALQRDGFVRLDYNSYRDWMNQRFAALTASGNYGADVIEMFRAEHLRELDAIRRGYHMYLFEDDTGLIRVLHNPADGEFAYNFRTGDNGVVYIEYGTEGNDVGWGVPLN
ncbi:MAG: hypothetical protein FWC70_08335 [Defluviitaleaceae bacterium]|nr:hypothetical protein [Defluviitaleaceae bacterium]